MTDCEELRNIVNNPDEENLKIEFKNSNILSTDGGKKKLAKEIVAFANKYGGRLILGINNDRTFEGKNVFDVDTDKGKITGIIRDRISPILNCEVEFLHCTEWEVIIINTPKRKDVPHAVVKKNNGKIINREYYIRTSHGIRDVSDKELQYLFKEESINFSYPFKIVINYLRDSLKIPPLGIERPICVQSYLCLIEKLPKEIIESIKKEFDNKFRFFMEITPYLLLSSFSYYFNYSWLIKIQRHNGQSRSSAISIDVPKKRILINELPDPSNDSLLSSLSIDIKKILEKMSFSHFFVPLNMDLNILKDDEIACYKIMMKHDDFKFIISFNFDMGGIGLDHLHPRKATYLNQYLYEGKENINDLFENIQLDCEFKTEFKFPESNPDLFDEYYHYAKTIKDILINEWDYQKFIKKLPHYLLYSIDSKLKDISNHLQNKKLDAG